MKSFLAAALLLLSTFLSAQQKRDITLFDILNGTRVTGVETSPGGRYVLERFTRTDTTSTRRYSVLKEVAGNREIATLEEEAHWMPRTEALLVRGGDTLWRIDPVSLQKDLIAKGLPEGEVQMAPGEDYLVVSCTQAGPEELDPDVFEILEPDDRQPHWRDRTYLVKWDLASREQTTLAKGPYSTFLEDFSADGKRLLLSSPRSRLSKRPTTVSDIVVMDSATIAADTLLRGAEFIETGRFSPDGKSILFRASPEAFDRIGEHIRPGQTSSMIFQVLYRYDIATGEVTPLTDRIPQSVGAFHWSRADGQVYFSAEDRDYVRLYTLNPKTGKIRSLEVPEDIVTDWSPAADAPALAYVGESVSNAKRCYLLDIKKKEHRLLEDSSAELLKDIRLGEVHDWNYRNSRGETIYGRFYLPPDFNPGRKYPMVVNYYGGCSPTERTFESRYPHHLYAAQGYVVYVVQPSGATGFGQEFAARHVNTWGEYGADDIIEGVQQFCREHPFVRADRVGCIGASFGGFMSQYLCTVTDIFACAISHAGISDITSYWGEGYWGYSYCEVSTAHNYPWNAAEMIVRQSPLFNADKVNTPLLFLHGTADTNVPVGESIQMFTALKLLGKETAFVAVRDQDHHILQYHKRIRWQETIFAWFAKYLQDDPSLWDALYPPKTL